jgi:hypothetical protein
VLEPEGQAADVNQRLVDAAVEPLDGALQSPDIGGPIPLAPKQRGRSRAASQRPRT